MLKFIATEYFNKKDQIFDLYLVNYIEPLRKKNHLTAMSPWNSKLSFVLQLLRSYSDNFITVFGRFRVGF